LLFFNQLFSLTGTIVVYPPILPLLRHFIGYFGLLKEKDLEKVQELVETVFYHFVVGDGAFWTGCRVLICLWEEKSKAPVMVKITPVHSFFGQLYKRGPLQHMDDEISVSYEEVSICNVQTLFVAWIECECCCGLELFIYSSFICHILGFIGFR